MIVAKRIVADIAGEGVSVGTRLPPEKAMLDQYQVGRGTLRESLRYLELSGVLSLKPGPGGGPTVERPDASHLMDALGLLLQFNDVSLQAVLEARAELDPLMARFAALRHTDEQLEQLRASVAKMAANMSSVDIFTDTNREFHDLVAWTSGNALLGYLVEALDGIFEVFSLQSEYPPRRRTRILKAHSAILDAIAARDADGAEESMRLHMDDVSGYLIKEFPDAMSKTINWQAMR
jgi:DNA-binding FadR family transcriptional regulator